MASAAPQTLWETTVRNGCSVPWWLWSGQRQFDSNDNNVAYNAAGWPLLLSTTGDLDISSQGIAPGQSLKTSFSITSIRAVNQFGEAILDPRIEICAFIPSVMYNQSGATTLTSAPVPGTDTLQFQRATPIEASAFHALKRSGGWGAGWKEWLGKIGGFMGRVGKASPSIVGALGMPELMPAAEAVSGVVRALGGKPMMGGSMIGGGRGGAVLAGSKTKPKGGAVLAGRRR